MLHLVSAHARQTSPWADNRKVAHMKQCNKCLRVLAVSEFTKDKSNASGTHLQCKECVSTRRTIWRAGKIDTERKREAKNASAKRARMGTDGVLAARLNHKYSITLKQYAAMLDSQGGVCAICHKPETAISANPAYKRTRNLSVDHDHACCSGKRSCGKCVRGLLCSSCNTGMGNLGDDIGTLFSAISYLSTWEDLVRPALEGFYGSSTEGAK